MFDEIGYEQEQQLARRQRTQAAQAQDRDLHMQTLEERLAAIEARLEEATAKLESLAATVTVA